MSYIGETAAVATSILWSATSIFFTLGTRRAGALAVNQARLLMALALLSATHWIASGTPFPVGAGAERWFWLALSGVVGLSLGDTFLFGALGAIGPRKSMLVMATSPIFTALAGWVIFGEAITLREGAGIFLTLSGVAWVVSERGGVQEAAGTLWRGIFLALGGSVCQSAGLLAAKQGMAGGFSPLSATLLRMLAAAVALLAVAGAGGKLRGIARKLRDRRTLLFTTLGGTTGPFLGVWMSLFSVVHAKVGVAATLMSLAPVFLIPMVYVAFGERATARGVAGTLVAFLGSALLFWGRG